MSAEQIIDSAVLPASVDNSSKDFIPKQLDYRQRNAQESYYKYTFRNRQNGSTNLVLGLNTSTEVVFDVATHPENLSRSTIDFDLLFAAGGVNNFENYFIHTPPFESVALRQKGGNDIVRIENFQDYWITVCLANKDLESYASNGMAQAGATVAAARLVGECNFMNPANNTAAVTTLIPSAYHIPNAGTALALNQQQRKNTALSSVISVAANAACALHCSVKLGDIAESIFALDQDLYAVEGLELVINWAPAVSYGLLNITTLGDVAATPAALAAAPTVSELRMRVAQEQNPSAIRAVKQLVHTSGMKLLIPHPTVRKYNLTNGTAVNYQVRINSGLGRNLLRVYTAERRNANTLNFRHNFHSVNAEKVTRFRTFLDGNPLQNNEIDCSKTQHWFNMKPLLRESVLGQSLADYFICPIWVDDFSGVDKLVDSKFYNKMDAGIKLNRELLYNKDYLQKANVDHDVIAVIVTQRMFHSGAEGVAVTI